LFQFLTNKTDFQWITGFYICKNIVNQQFGNQDPMKKNLPLFSFFLLLWLPLILAGNPPLPCRISVTGGESGICQGQPLVLIAKVDDGLSELTRHQWETDGMLLSAPDQSFVKFDTEQAGVFLVKYFAWDEEGKQAQCALSIEVKNPPEFEIVENFGLFQRILFKKPKLLIQINSLESHTFQWFLNGEPIIGATGPEFKPSTGGKYHARVTSPQGCSTFSKEKVIE
jgi:hypothetical protein